MEKAINIIIALASSSSIAVWAIWSEMPLLWATIVALSQVISVVKPYFPYNKYVKELNSKTYSLPLLNNKFEKLFFDLDNNNYDVRVIQDRYFTLTNEEIEICHLSDEMNYTEREKDKQNAEKLLEEYLRAKYKV